MTKKQKTKQNFYLDIKLLTAVTLVAGSLIFGAHIQGVKADRTDSKSTQKSVKSMQTIEEQICSATEGENCDVIFNLCKAESGCKKYAVNKNKNGSIDYSYFQINSVHIKEYNRKGTISIECVYNISCVSRWVNEQIKAGRGSMWVAWRKI